MKDNKIELRSPIINEILTRPPTWIVVWGSSVILLIITTLLIFSYFFKYPDYIEATVIITTEKPPIWLNARNTAIISGLFASNFEIVKKGQVIAILENKANASDVFYIKSIINDSTLFNLDYLIKNPGVFKKRLSLGELQMNWNILNDKFTQYLLTTELDNYEGKKITLQKEFSLLLQKLKTLERKKNIQKKELKIVQEQFEKEKKLFEKGFISTNELQLAEQNLLNSKQILEEIEFGINIANSEKVRFLQNIENETYNQNKTLLQKEQEYYMALKELVYTLKSWEHTNIIESPVNGKLIFPDKTNLLQQVKSGDRLFAVIPENPGKLQAYLKFVPSGSGKVKKGQKVRIHIDGYPYMEYGTVSGTIKNVSLMPNSENQYTAIAIIPNPLITDYSKKLPFPGELTGVAQIHTEETRLLFRIITPLKYLVMSQKN